VKLIFSRKGFDSSAGGVPSPLVDGRPISLPIPTRMPTPTRFRELPNEVAELYPTLRGAESQSIGHVIWTPISMRSRWHASPGGVGHWDRFPPHRLEYAEYPVPGRVPFQHSLRQ
jgi:hypothetical protein